jgi:alpha-L-fucosidase
MARVENPRDTPDRWRAVQTPVPFLRDEGGARRVFGVPMLREGDWIYVYGLETVEGGLDRHLLAGRVNAAELDDFSKWEFYAEDRWQGDFRKASRLCNHLGAEFSVSFVPGLRKYALVYTYLGLSDRIQLRLSDSPVGPWSEERTVYRAPEAGWDKTYFCYAAKGHPELSKENEILISYACNSSDFDKARRDTRIYVPKFIRIKFAAQTPVVRERVLPDGLTELDVTCGSGTNATYRLDLKTHHEPATEDSGAIRQWEQYRYGGFFCYNDNQFSGLELPTGKDPKLYSPTNLNVAGWASAMRDAGMRYAVLTARHTSGFLLWDSATTEFDVASSGSRTDVCAEFVKQCRLNGIAPGFYYCLWGGPWIPNDNARAVILAQLHELATRYGEIPYFWIDMGNWRPANLSPQEIYDSVKNAQPNAIVILNQHIQDGSKLNYFPTDVVNGEVCLPPEAGHQPFRQVNGKRYYLPFEFEPVSQRIPKGTTTPWGNVGAWFTVRHSQPFPPRDLFEWIRQAYARGANNVLLSLSADHTGSMRPEDIEQLRELGRLLREAGLLAVPRPAEPPPPSLAAGKPARASGVWEDNDREYGPAAAFDDNPSTRWGGAVGTKSGWLEVDLGSAATVSRAAIQEGWDRTRRFAVQYKAGDEWKDAAGGTTIGTGRELKFAPVKAQVFRLNILEATDVPTIWEFQLFASRN